MCGIAGIYNLNQQTLNSQTLKVFTDSIAHRGPDGAGYEIVESDCLGFGHRRLSILDLSEAGKQPMYSKNKKHLITYNGEVYNFLEIRKELELLGNKFYTQTDTEVIISAYEQWGIACLNKLNGMFAIAIWDFENKALTLIRDRFGVKPLYFLYIPEQIFAFASETIAFKYLNNFKREINSETFQLALQRPELLEGTDKTIYKNIYQLRPGHYLLLQGKSKPELKRWWNTKEHIGKVPSGYSQQVEKFTELFEDACKLRMRSDVTLASALSGGLDSSSVYSTLYKINKTQKNIERLPTNWQQAFVATFPGTSVDEKHYAEKVVSAINGNAVYLEPDYKNLVTDIISSTKLFDSIAATPLLSISDIYKGMRKRGVTVSMDGHGVDEMMYGYNSYVYQAFYDCIESGNQKKAEEYANILCGLSPSFKIDSLRETIKSSKKSVLNKVASLIKRKLATKNSVHSGIDSVKSSWYLNTDLGLINSVVSQHDAPENWLRSEKMVYNDFHYLSLPINLRDFDRAAMQNGIEIRMPFMDYRIVSYVFSLPIESKLGGGFTKRILRDAMKGTLPEEIRTRTLKIGIGAPMKEWFEGDLKNFIMDCIHSKSFIESQYWNGNIISLEIEKAYKENTLDKTMCNKAWNVLNAHIIINGN